jgi:hypothetical protein
MSVYDIVYGIVWLIIGTFFGTILARVVLYKLIHPYIGIPYLKRRQKRDEQEQYDQKQKSGKES